MRRIPALLIAGCLLAAGSSTAEEPRRYTPLAADEILHAIERAEHGRRARLEATPDGRAALQAATEDTRELLSVERHRRSKSERRRGLGRSADVYHYDYERNVTVHTVVRLPSGDVESIRDLPGVQLPLTQREIDRATRIAYADPTVRNRIDSLFRQATGEVLGDLDQLHAKAMVFSARTMPGSLNADSQRCGEHRCAQLLLFTADHVTVEIIPIVDLTTGALVQVLDF